MAEESIISEVADIDGNKYKTIEIGDQIWMMENLHVTHYSDGSEIPLVTEKVSWDILTYTDKAYCWYNNDEASVPQFYGALYTWAAATRGAANNSAIPSAIQGACPTGWHIPNDMEWSILTDFLKGKAKSMAAQTGWQPNQNPGTVGNDMISNNSSGFNAFPAGYRLTRGEFASIKFTAAWWSCTDSSNNWARIRAIYYNSGIIENAATDKKYGLSVRCVRNY